MAKYLLLLSLLALAVLSLGHAKDVSPSTSGNNLNFVFDSNPSTAENNINAVSSSKDNTTFGDVIDDANLKEGDVNKLNDDVLDDLVELVEDSVSGARVADELDGFPTESLDQNGLDELVKVEDDIFVAELDIHIAKQRYLSYKALTSLTQGRRKRAIPLLPLLPVIGRAAAPVIGRAALRIGRTLIKNYPRTHRTISGRRITQHYGARGNYQDAVRDFTNMRPTNVRPINGRYNGQTGRVGNYRVTVRDGSSKGHSNPTLSVHREGNKHFVRKFRYE